MDNDYMLTTYDNTFNPFTEFEAWFKEDHRLMHNTCELLDSLSFCNFEVFSDEENQAEILRAMKEIVDRWPMIYKMVLKSDYSKKSA